MAEFETHQNRSAEAGAGQAGEESRWLDLTRNAWRASASFIDTNLRRVWENNLRAFQSQHPGGSKYYGSDYKHRSKVYRPKTRATVRKLEAAAAAAFFSTMDVISVKAQNDNDPRQKASALINKELLQHYLMNDCHWFLTCMGAWQDGQVQGICISRQTWKYETRVERVDSVARQDDQGMPVIDADTGMPVIDEVPVTKVVKDHPWIDPIPPENLRVDPGADWRDPINSSPFLQVLWPMYAVDVKARTKEGNHPGGRWNEVTDEQLATARQSDMDSTRRTREQDRTDSKELETGVKDFDTVWVIENWMRVDGEDWHYFTLMTNHMLSEPTPAREVYPHAPRPVTMGLGSIEAHKVYPSSKVEQIGPLQQEANDVANQRLDNVKLAMNARYFVRRGKQVDLQALLRSVPGGATLMNDPKTDVIVHRAPDVTSSSYAEQDRLNVDFDELAGSFSAGSVQSNRQLNETVGGLNILSQGSNAITEYDLRIFSETWVEPTLRQLMKLVQRYVTDETLIGIAAEKAKLYQRFGINQVDDAILEQELTTTVNVGIGSTDPMQKVQRFFAGMSGIAQIPPWMLKILNLHEVFTEVFGNIGYRDGERFITLGENPEVKQLQLIIEQMQGEIEGRQLEAKAKIQVAEIGAKAKLAEQQLENQGDLEVEKLRARAKAIEQFRQLTAASGESERQRQHDAGAKVFDARARAAEQRASAAQTAKGT